jgi:hypothetical protein
MICQPYAVVREGRFYYAVDRRTGIKVSYPETTRWNADQHVATLNNAYREALLETSHG